ncbi:reverse transcriptase domain-containing protein [Tanacetum coccineum]
MSSPDHPISNLEDVFSSNFPNYVPPASPDYVPTSPGKTYSSASNSFGIRTPFTMQLSHLPIPTSSSEIGETSGNQLSNVREQISGISRMPPKRASTTEAPAMTQDAIRKLVADSSLGLYEAQAADNVKCLGLIRGLNESESVFSRADSKPINHWTELKRLLTNKYYPRSEIRKIEEELYNLIVKGNDLKPYVRRFQELTVLCPNMVPNNDKLLEAFIGGLPRSIEGNVTASKPKL